MNIMDEKRPLVNDNVGASPAVAPAVHQPISYQQPPAATVQPIVQQPIVVQVVPVRRGPRIKTDYKSVFSRRSGIAQLVLGCLAIVINIAGIVLQVWTPYAYYPDNNEYDTLYFRENYMYYQAAGIWCPLLFVSLSGAFALAAACRKTTCMIITSMVFNILGSVASGIMLVCAGFAVGSDIAHMHRGFYFEKDNDYFNHARSDQEEGERLYCHPAARTTTALLVLSILWVLLSITLLSLCIWTATLACRVLCKQASLTTSDQEPGVTARYVVDQTGSVGSQLLVVDSQGRPISGAQVIQLPAPGTSQTVPQTGYPGNVQAMASNVAPLDEKQAIDRGLPPPYE